MFSLFGDDDPCGYGNPFEEMDRMMSNMRSRMNFPFGMGINPLMEQSLMPQSRMQMQHPMLQMNPFSAVSRNMNYMREMNAFPQRGNVSYQSSSSFVSYSSDTNGQPRVIQKSSSTNIGPNGTKQTTKSLRDSGTGENKMSIGRHIGDRSHTKEKSENRKTGDAEETQEFINLDEEEAESFNKEYNQHISRGHTGHLQHRITHNHSGRHRPMPYYNRHRQPAAIAYDQKSDHDRDSSLNNQEQSSSKK